MTRKRKGRTNRKGFVAIPFSTFITLDTLADNTVIKANILGNDLAEDLFIISIDGLWTLRNLTGGETPIEIGLAHSDYTIAEILENLEIEVISPDAKIEMERAKRKIRRVGIFAKGDRTDQGIGDGMPLRTKLLFTVGNSQNLALWARNISGATLTTGALIQGNGTIFGRWLR